MPPSQTAAAADHSDARVAEAFASLVDATDDADERHRLALACSRLTVRNSGLRLSNYAGHAGVSTCPPRFVSSYAECRPACCRVLPALATLSVTSPTTASTSEFAASYAAVLTELASVRSRHAELDRDKRWWVDGSVHSAFHPRLPGGLDLPDVQGLASLLEDPTNNIRSRCSQRKLVGVFDAGAWLRTKDEVDAFDAANLHGATPHREGARMVSHSQEGAGTHYERLPDPSLHGTVVESSALIAIVQRHLGLYVSCLAPTLDARAARGEAVTQADRLGDTAIHAANATARHNAGLHAIYTALSSATAAGVSIRLGDKGDGTPASKADALQRHAHLNSTHVPDIIRYGARIDLYEWKCWSIFLAGGSLGLGSTRLGGAASTVEGWKFAFGRLEELRTVTYGHEARDTDNPRPLDRLTGDGRVSRKTGAYSDGVAKGHGVHLLVSEPSGACDPATVRLLRDTSKAVGLPGIHDSTIYGSSRASTQSFFYHHLASISSAIVRSDALTLLNHAAHESFQLTLAFPVPRTPAGLTGGRHA